jgi:hypothetical protein
MPGYLIEANCSCGYSNSLQTGANLDSKIYVMSYTKDGNELKTRLLPMVPVSPYMVISGARFISIGNC